MLTEPILKGMNADDLNQRYANSLMLYNGKYVTVAAFKSHNVFELLETGRNQPFNWELVNIERPPSRWYPFNYEGHNLIGYLSYKNSRQYVRGITNRNTDFFCPLRGYHLDVLIMNQIHEVWTKKTQPKPVTAKILEEDVKKKSWCLLSPKMVVVNDILFYRLAKIGTYYKDKIHLENSNFTQELIDLKLQDLISYEPLKKNENPQLKPKLKSLFDNWANELILDTAPPRRTAAQVNLNNAILPPVNFGQFLREREQLLDRRIAEEAARAHDDIPDVDIREDAGDIEENDF